MENGDTCKYVYDFANGRDHHEIIAKFWMKDFYTFATKEIAGEFK